MTNRADRIASLSTTKLALLARQTYGQVEDILNAEPIAIVGIGLRFPGADDPESFWKLLMEKRSAMSEVPADRFDLDAYYDPDFAAPGKMNFRKSGFLRQVDQFDPAFFGITEREAAQMDPQQRMVLEVAYEALDDAGMSDQAVAGSETGFFLASYHNDFQRLIYARPEQIDLRTLTGSLHCISANRLSYLLDLHGPSMALDSACSSSLVAVHLACQSLRARECDTCLAGGVNAILTPGTNIALTKVGFISPTGECHTFDAQADGFIRGEGCGVVVLKRLSDALAAGDRVFAVVRGSAVNQDGRSTVLTAPNGLAQQALIRRALRNAGLRPEQIGMIEAHGTGTHLGDPLEVEAIAQVIGAPKSPEQRCYLTSVKANIGHLEAAAGIAGIIKTALCLYHGAIPPQPNFTRLNPEINLNGTPLAVPDEIVPWPEGERARFAGVSSFGVGGTNAHVILGAAPLLAESGVPQAEAPASRACLLPISARSPQALADQAQAYMEYLQGLDPSSSLYDMCYTASLRRSHYEYRLAVTGKTPEQMAGQLSALLQNPAWLDGVHRHKVGDEQPPVAFVFSGQGTQWARMGHELIEHEPVFRAVIEQCDALLKPLAGWSLLEKLAAPEGESSVQETEVAQPAIFAVQMGLDALWRSWGVSPEAVVGHSLGEIAAACSAGILTLEDAIFLVYHRGRLMQQATGLGKMVSIDLPAAEVEPAVVPFADRVAVAALNSPRSTVISGPADAVDAVLAALAPAGAGVHPLRVNYAFHSPMMSPYARELETTLHALTPRSEQARFISTVAGKQLPGPELTASYWGSNIRQTVRFTEAIALLTQQGISVFLEIGPHPTLSPMIEQCLAVYDPDSARLTAASLRRGQPEEDTLLAGMARLYQAGVPLRWQALYPRRGQVISLPAYRWQRHRCWIDDGPEPVQEPEEMLPGHPLLGRAVDSPVFDGTLYQQSIASSRPAFLKDHRVFGQPVLPAAAMLEMMLQAASESDLPGAARLADVRFDEALLLPEGAQRSVQLHLEPGEQMSSTLQIYSKAQDGKWLRHAASQLLPADGQEPTAVEPLAEIRAHLLETVTGAEYYARAFGVTFGPAFQGIQTIWRADGEALAELRLPEPLREEAQRYTIHPALLDAALQPVTAALPATGTDVCYMPLGIAGLRLFAPLPQVVWSYVRVTDGQDGNGESVTCQVQVFDAQGTLLLMVEGLTFKRVSEATLRRIFRRQSPEDSERTGEDWFYQVQWLPVPAAVTQAASLTGRWVIFGDAAAGLESLTGLLAGRIRSAGGTAIVASAGPESKTISADESSINPECAEDYHALFQSLAAGGSIEGIINLWSLGAQDPTGNVDTDFQRLKSALYLSQAVLTAWTQDPPALWLVTAGAQPAGRAISDPSGAALWGLANTLLLEHPDFPCRCLDLDPLALPADQAREMEAELLSSNGGAKIDRIAYQDGQRLAAQLAPLNNRVDESTAQPMRLAVSAPGQLDSLQLQPIPRAQPGPGEVEIRVQAAGLNFRDVLKVLGRYPAEETQAGIQLGDECAGVVSAVGSGVSGFNVGDEVIALAVSCFASYVVAPARLVFPKPAALSNEEAASLPIPFLTAAYSLLELAHLSAGQSVLIHAAAGGVGLAAVQLAQAAGAVVYATAGSPEKRAYLQSLGVPYIYDSRSLAFAEAIKAQTNGRGVDVVLNSLAGDFIPASLSVLAQNGCFLEIGKTGILTREQAAQSRPDAAYHAVYLGELYTTNPELVRGMMERILARITAGELSPLPRRVFPIQQAQEALRFMARARHIGKIVLNLPSAEAERADGEDLLFRADGVYLVTGGMGGIGRAVLRWMAGSGARHFALVSRSGEGHTEAGAVRAELEAAGAQVSIYAADAASFEEMARVIADIRAGDAPLRGVIHAAGVVMDGVVLQQDWERCKAVLAGKAAGAWNLHLLTRHLSLDHFILFSSIAGPLGSAGQGNYAAANMFLGALASVRRAEGLPALCVDWGVWERTGMTARLDAAGQQAQARRGLLSIPPAAGGDALGYAMRQAQPECLILPVDWQAYLRETQSGGRFFFESVQARSQKAAGQAQAAKGKAPEPAKPRLLRLLEETPAVQRRGALIQFLHQEVVRLVGLPPEQTIDPRQPLNTLGLDSLMAVEMRNALSAAVGKSLPATLLFDYPTSEALSGYLLQSIPGLVGEAPAAPTAAAEKVIEPSDQTVQQMTDEEAEAELLAELARLKKS